MGELPPCRDLFVIEAFFGKLPWSHAPVAYDLSGFNPSAYSGGELQSCCERAP